MMSNKGCHYICVLLYFVLQNGNVFGGMTDEEAKADFTKVLLSCAQDASIEIKDVMSLASLIGLSDPKIKCILACTFRKKGSLNDKGMYDINGAYAYVESVYKGDEDRVKKGKEFADFCTYVNNEKVSDGEKGCDRAAMMFKCNVKNALKFGFKI